MRQQGGAIVFGKRLKTTFKRHFPFSGCPFHICGQILLAEMWSEENLFSKNRPIVQLADAIHTVFN